MKIKNKRKRDKGRPGQKRVGKAAMEGERERLIQPQRAKEDKHTGRATVQVKNLTTACTPGGREGSRKKK